MTLQMKNRQIHIKVKTLTDELRQKETFDRLYCLAQVAESVPIDDTRIPSPGFQQDIPLGKKHTNAIEVAESMPIDDIVFLLQGSNKIYPLEKKRLMTLKLQSLIPKSQLSIQRNKNYISKIQKKWV